MTDPPRRVKVKLKNHPEFLRWTWYKSRIEHSETQEERDNNIELFCEHYFIIESELDLWTYDEWADAYIKTINGTYNRVLKTKIKYGDV